MDGKSIYEPCSRCRTEMVLGGGLCPDCAEEVAQSGHNQALAGEVVAACDGILDLVYPDGTPQPMVVEQDIRAAIHDLALAIQAVFREEI